MNTTLKYIREKYKLSYGVPVPIKLTPFDRFVDLVALFKELNFKTGAEIGVEDGSNSEILLRGVPKLTLYCIDPWKEYSEYREPWAKQNALSQNFELTKFRLSKYKCTIIRKMSMEGVKDFKPDSLDFVFIDGNHDFEYVINDIICWTKIVRPGGIISGHDYLLNNKYPWMHVPYAVNAYTKAYKINPWFVTHRKGTEDCWMWVKQ